ncbi:MAG TPA: hypothetical protein VIV60_26330 [Polyangiaceae bacterium]
MSKSQVIVRRTVQPHVLELELVLPRQIIGSLRVDDVFRQNRIRSLCSYVTNTRQNALLHARVARSDGAPIGTEQMGQLLDGLRSFLQVASMSRAAAAA